MLQLIRIAAYILSGVTLCQVFSGNALTDLFASGRVIALDQEHSFFLGVCSGVSSYTGVDVTFIRLIWAMVSLYRGLGLGLYLLAFLIMPLPE